MLSVTALRSKLQNPIAAVQASARSDLLIIGGWEREALIASGFLVTKRT